MRKLKRVEQIGKEKRWPCDGDRLTSRGEPKKERSEQTERSMMAHVIYTAARVLYANAEPVTVCLAGITGGLRIKIK